MKNFEEMKKDNKGFSLVELIVVIAIMAVLIAVLGSTILGYVEKSKYSKDVQALDSVKTAVSSFVADPDSSYASGTTYTLTALMAAEHDPNGVIKATLQEVFAFPANNTTGETNTTAAVNFNASSAAFKGTTSDNVSITITNGAVYINVPSKSNDYDAYTAGVAPATTTGGNGGTTS